MGISQKIQTVLSDYWFLASIRTSDEVAVIIDNRFNYIAVSRGMCKLLNRERGELEGKCMTVLYPDIVNFKNYENLKRALKGEDFIDVVPAITGDMFEIHYRPIHYGNEVLGVQTVCRRV